MLGTALAERTMNSQLLPTCPPRQGTENEWTGSPILWPQTVDRGPAAISDRSEWFRTGRRTALQIASLGLNVQRRDSIWQGTIGASMMLDPGTQTGRGDPFGRLWPTAPEWRIIARPSTFRSRP
jgi:hypothetical protein